MPHAISNPTGLAQQTPRMRSSARKHASHCALYVLVLLLSCRSISAFYYIPDIDVFYIPQEDCHRAPGYSGDGLFIPLSQIMSLLRDTQTTSAGGMRLSENVYCTKIDLTGTVDNAL